MAAKTRGRPRVGEMVSFTIRPDQKKAIEALAVLWGVKQAWVVRYLLDHSLPSVTTSAISPFTTPGANTDSQAAD